MDIKELILKKLDSDGEVRARDIVKDTGFSRVYVNRFLRELRDESRIALVGKANTARYIPAGKGVVDKVKSSVRKVYRILRNSGLSEDKVLAEVKENTGLFLGLSGKVSSILDYAFTEMLNNAIEHSGSDRIEVIMKRKKDTFTFEVKDEGVGIFANIMNKKHLDSEKDAIRDLLKGKETTAPASHSGEGIFFTSKVGDMFTIQSEGKKLIFDNLIKDIFLKESKTKKRGTLIFFSVSTSSKRDLNDVFNNYTDGSAGFNKTEIIIKLYEEGANYVSRSQARRLLAGLEKFKTVVLDFKGIEAIGQAFADEIFRVWKSGHTDKDISVRNACENVMFMVRRTKQDGSF
ncbi:MAG: DUF4325 domain-containing protein [Candidatus Omnitrophota bacterium]